MDKIMVGEIEKAIEKANAQLCAAGYIVIAIMLYGSQNYGMATPTSDIDLKAIIVPSFEDIVHGRKMVSTTIEIDEGLCDVKDIRSMMNCWKKQNVNFVELLFTKYRWINPDYEEILQPLFEHREEIVHYDEKHAINCIRGGMMMEKYHALFKPYPAQKEVVEKYGYAAKQLSHIWRLKDLIVKYIRGYSYEMCLTPDKMTAKQLIAIKTYEKLYTDMDEVAASGRAAMDIVEGLLKDFTPAMVNEKTGELMDRVTADVIRKALKKELMEG